MTSPYENEDDPAEAPTDKIRPRPKSRPVLKAALGLDGSRDRRASDGARKGTIWAMVIGILFQGGFAATTWGLLQMQERERIAERSFFEKQLDAERRLVERQHIDMVASINGLTASLRQIADVTSKALEEMHRAQAAADAEREKYERYTGRRLK